MLWTSDGRGFSMAARSLSAGRRSRLAKTAVTVPVRRGGLLSLVAPIPPATVSFRATAVVHEGGSPKARALLDALGTHVPLDRRASAAVIEIAPEGELLTYGLGVPLRQMLDPALAQARAPVTT